MASTSPRTLAPFEYPASTGRLSPSALRRPPDPNSFQSGFSVEEEPMVAQKQLELAMAQNHTIRSQKEMLLRKEEEIAQLSAYIRRLQADFHFNANLAEQLRSTVRQLQEQGVQMKSELGACHEKIRQLEGAAAVREGELNVRQQELKDATMAYDEEVNALHRALSEAREQSEMAIARKEQDAASAIAEAQQTLERRLRAELAASEHGRQQLAAELSTIRQQSQLENERLTDHISTAESRLEEKRTEVTRLQIEVDELRSKLTTVLRTSEMNEAKLRRENEEVRQSKAELEARFFDQQKVHNATAAQLEVSHREEAARVSQLDISLSCANVEINSLKSRLESVTQSADQERRRADSVSEEWQNRFDEVTRTLNSQRVSAENRAKEAEARLAEQKQQLSNAQVEIGRAMSKVEESKTEAQRIGREKLDALEAAARERKRADEVMRDFDSLRSQLAASERNRHAVEREYELEREQSMADLQKTKHEAKCSVTAASNEITTLKRQLHESDNDRRLLSDQLAEYNATDWPGKVSSLRQRVRDLEGTVADLKNQKNTLHEQVNRITQELQSDPLLIDAREKQLRLVEVEALLVAAKAETEKNNREIQTFREELRSVREHATRSERLLIEERRSWEAQVSQLQEELEDERRRCDALDAAEQAAGNTSGTGTGSTHRILMELERLRKRNRELQSSVEESMAGKGQATAQVQQLTASVEVLQRERDDLETINARLIHQLRQYQQQRDVTASSSQLGIAKTPGPALPLNHSGTHTAAAPINTRLDALEEQLRALSVVGMATGAKGGLRGTTPSGSSVGRSTGHTPPGAVVRRGGSAVRNYNYE